MTIGKVGLAIGLAAALVACGKKSEPEKAPMMAPAPAVEEPAPAMAPTMTMPTAMHGGQMVMSGDYHAEIVTGDEIEAYFYDKSGKMMAPPAGAKLHISMADGHRTSLDMEIHGEHLTTTTLKKAHAHKPYDAAVGVSFGGETLNFRFTVAK